MFAQEARLRMILRRTLSVLLLLALLGAWSPRPVVLAEQTEIPAAEYDALVALYNSTDGANWTNKWTLPTDMPCSLYGVSCTSSAPRCVVALSLMSNQLNGAIPTELGNLSNLPDIVEGIDVQGAYAYVADRWRGFVVDVSDPTNPRQVGNWPNGWVHGVAVDGPYAYTAGVGGMEIWISPIRLRRYSAAISILLGTANGSPFRERMPITLTGAQDCALSTYQRPQRPLR